MLITGETVCWVWWDIWELSVLSDKFPINLKLFEKNKTMKTHYFFGKCHPYHHHHHPP